MRSVDPHPSAGVTGSPTIYQNRLYVPVASGEEGQGGNERYECCTFRGSIVALDLYSGNVVWKTFTIPQEPRTIGRNKSGTVRWGPAGAGIWSSPTIDPKRRVLYTASGNQYTEPQTESSDAIFAMDLDTGKLAWQAQVLAKDVFVVGCNQPNTPNCPPGSELGPDFDFGQSPMLTTLPDGRDLIVIGQKSGQGWALDPDKKGAVVWRYDAGKGTALGGMEFGSTNDGENAYFALNDGNFPTAGEMHAVKLSTGERAWKTSPPDARLRRTRPRLHAGTARRHHLDARRGVRRVDGRRHPRLFDQGRVDHLAVQLEYGVHDGERRAGQGRVDQRPRPGHRGWNALTSTPATVRSADGRATCCSRSAWNRTLSI